MTTLTQPERDAVTKLKCLEDNARLAGEMTVYRPAFLQARDIAQSIRAQLGGGLGFSLTDFGIADNPALVAMVVKHLHD